MFNNGYSNLAFPMSLNFIIGTNDTDRVRNRQEILKSIALLNKGGDPADIIKRNILRSASE